MRGIQYYIALLIVISLFMCSCCNNRKDSNKNNNSKTESREEIEDQDGYSIEVEAEYCSFYDTIAYSDTAVIAEYLEFSDYGDYIEWSFKVNDILYGETGDDIIHFFDYKAEYMVEGYGPYARDFEIFESGKQYLLLLNRYQNIMYDHDRYVMPGFIYLNITDETYKEYEKLLSFDSVDALIHEVISTHETVGGKESTSMNEGKKDSGFEPVLRESQFVASVSILEKEIEGVEHNGDTYRCTIKEVFLGDKGEIDTYEDGTILIVLRKGSVSKGEDYIIGFDQVDEHSRIYTEATVDAVWEPTEELLTRLEEARKDSLD